MTDALIDYLLTDLNESNCCLIYDQMMNFQNVNLLQLDDVKVMIINDTKKAFESEYFTKIQPSTLISLLNFDKLNISELDLLKACWRYVKDNVNAFENDSSKESKRNFFKQFRNFIRFDKIDPDDLANFEHIDDLLTYEELAFLLLHSHNPKMPLNIECLTKRMIGNSFYSVFYECNFDCYGSVTTTLKVNEKVNIKVIHTSVKSTKDLNLIIRNAQNIDLKLEIEKFVLNDKWSFKFKKCFEVQENTDYKLEFQSKGNTYVTVSLQKISEFKVNRKNLIFQLYFQSGSFHYIAQIDFLIPNNRISLP